MKPISTYIRISFIHRILLGIFLSMAGSSILAQSTDNIDTTVIEEVVPADDYSDDQEKSAEDEYFWEKEYQDDSWMQYKERNISDSALKKMQQDDDFWYANAVFNKEKKKEKNQGAYVPLGQRTWFQTLIWIIIVGGFVTFLIMYLAGTEVGLFRKKSVPVNSKEEEEMPEDIFAINYQKEIDKAAAQGNYRLAVRLMFLRLLKHMSEKNVINYKQDKTNLDYLMHLYSTRYYHDFFRITRHYEYSWYGKFEVSSDAYHQISKEMLQFENQLGKS